MARDWKSGPLGGGHYRAEVPSIALEGIRQSSEVDSGLESA